MYTIFLTAITSCAKDVKAPTTKNTSNTKTTTTNTGTQNTDHSPHTCGGGGDHTATHGNGGGN